MTPLEIPVTWDSYEILAALAPGARSYLCVGVQEGECLGHVLRSNPKIERLALCDTWGPHHGGTNRGSHAHVEERLSRAGFGGSVIWLDGPSQSLVPTLDDTYDLSYVDGSHGEDDAFADFCNVWPRTSWAMVCHDIKMSPVSQALDRFLERFPSVSLHRALGGHGTAIVYHGKAGT